MIETKGKRSFCKILSGKEEKNASGSGFIAAKVLGVTSEKIKITIVRRIEPINTPTSPYNFINNIELDTTISEEVELVNGMLPKGLYKLTQDITFDKEDADTPDALMGDEVQTFEDTAPSDTVLGVDIFSVVHIPTQTKIFVSAEDVQKIGIEDLEL